MPEIAAGSALYARLFAVHHIGMGTDIVESEQDWPAIWGADRVVNDLSVILQIFLRSFVIFQGKFDYRPLDVKVYRLFYFSAYHPHSTQHGSGNQCTGSQPQVFLLFLVPDALFYC